MYKIDHKLARSYFRLVGCGKDRVDARLRIRFEREVRFVTAGVFLPVSAGVVLVAFLHLSVVWLPILLAVPVCAALARSALVPRVFTRLRWRRRSPIFAWFVFYRPFSFGSVWWWTLILGLVTIVARAARDAGIRDLPSPPLEELIAQVCAALVAAAVAYIATNLINQLFQLRDDFGSVGEELGGAVDQAGNLRREVGGLTHEVKTAGKAAVGILEMTLESAGISHRWAELLKSEGTSNTVRVEASKLLKQQLSSSENFLHQIEVVEEDVRIVPFVGEVLRTFLAGQSRVLNTRRRHLITRFSNLGKMSMEVTRLAARQRRDLVVFGVLVVPPMKFLHYDQQAFGACPILRDLDWWKFLEENRQVAEEGEVEVIRHFLAVKPNNSYGRLAEAAADGDQLSFPKNALGMGAYRAFPEVAEIVSERVRRQLNRFVLCGVEDGLPVAEVEDTYLRWKDIGGKLLKDGIGVTFPTSDSMMCVVPEVEFPVRWRSLRDLLGSVFHKRGRAWILEYDQETDVTLEGLVDDRKKKLKDYLALGERREQGRISWCLCLKSLYDRDFDVADVEILHAGSEEDWQGMCETLTGLLGEYRESRPRGFRRRDILEYGVEGTLPG